jgi:autophagy-related protein 2
LQSAGRKTGHSVRRGFSAAPESVLRELNFIHVLNLDSMEAVVIISNASSSEPKITTSITFGIFCLYACQDSFECLVGTISEWQSRITALTEAQFSVLKSKSMTPESETRLSNELSSDDQSKDLGGRTGLYPGLLGQVIQDNHFPRPRSKTLDDIKKKSVLGPAHAVQTSQERGSRDFMLDGYDWTTIDHDAALASDIPDGEEQVARWYMAAEQQEPLEPLYSYTSGSFDDAGTSWNRASGKRSLKMDFHHFALQPVSNPLGEGDMGATKFAGTSDSPAVNLRILVHELGVRVRLFDGYDWPSSLDPLRRRQHPDPVFIISEPIKKDNMETSSPVEHGKANRLDKKSKLLDELLATEQTGKNPLYEDPLPREKAARLEKEAEIRRLSRRANKFLQISASGVSLRVDSFVDTPIHKLASCLDLSVHDFFVAESISDKTIRKMVGEWVNEDEHPRDTSEGLLNMKVRFADCSKCNRQSLTTRPSGSQKMVTWHPAARVTSTNRLASDECQVRVELLPLRCKVDQRAVRFARAFFGGSQDEEVLKQKMPDWALGMHLVQPPLFQLFCVKRFRLKVDYSPEKIDVNALREGSYVELINLSPLDGMVLTLKKVELYGYVGFDSAVGELLRRWVQDICATQLHKFITNARPFEPVTHVGGGIFDLVVLPWEAFRSGGSITRGIRSGLASLAGAVAYETLTTTSRVTQFAADGLAKAISSQDGPTTSSTSSLSFPSRPMVTPRSLSDVTGHALESVARGVRAANYKVVIVPFREYRKSGPSGAAKSVLKGIPVAIMAPISGATEALSYTLLGARNHIRPDIRKEEEASHRGLHYDL